MIWLVRRLHSWAAWLLAASVVLQAFLAGMALPGLGGNGDFSTHASVGYLLPGLLALVVVLTAVVARLGAIQIGWSVALLVLYVIQTSLPSAKGSAPIIAALHPANAFLMFAAAIWVARRPTHSAAAPPDVTVPAQPATPPEND